MLRFIFGIELRLLPNVLSSIPERGNDQFRFALDSLGVFSEEVRVLSRRTHGKTELRRSRQIDRL